METDVALKGQDPNSVRATSPLSTRQGEGGIQPGSEAYFKLARELCDECGALLICDEVQVGMGRSGKVSSPLLGSPW